MEKDRGAGSGEKPEEKRFLTRKGSEVSRSVSTPVPGEPWAKSRPLGGGGGQ